MRLLLGVVMACALIGACKRDSAHQHASEHPSGHDHHEEGHGHAGGPVSRITLWSDQFELFAEHEAAVAGKKLTLLAHVTVLDGFRPLKEGTVKLELEGPAALAAEAVGPTRPGIRELEVVPKAAG